MKLARIASTSELAGEGPFALAAEGVDLAVVRVGQSWRAFEGRCPHLGALLGEGEIVQGRLVCRNHGWRFALDSGRRDGGPQCLASCPVVERDGALFADVSALRPAAVRAGTRRRLKDLPGPKQLPFVGNLHQLDPAAVHLILEGWEAQYGPLYRFRMGPLRALAVSDPPLIDQILRARPETFRRQAGMNRVLTEIGVHGVFNAEGDVWRPQRRLAVAALAQRHLRRLYPHIATVARRLHGRWQTLAASGETLDAVKELKRFTVDVTMLVAFGHDVNTVEQGDDAIQQHLEVMFPKIAQRIFALVPTWRFLKLPGDRRFDHSLAEIRGWLATLLEQARRRAATGENGEKTTFLDAMATALDENGQPFSDEVVMSNLVTMVLAGEDTTAFTLAWAVHELARAEDWAGQLRQEADRVLGAAVAAEGVEAATALPIAGAVANETMRLRPVAPVTLLDANVDTVIGDIEIPAGTTIAVLSRPAAVAEAHFSHPREFRPERWLQKPDGAHDLAAHIPFGSGPRMCPGRSLALLEMSTLLSMLYKNFAVERVGAAEDVKELFGFTMSPLGLQIRLHPRAP